MLCVFSPYPTSFVINLLKYLTEEVQTVYLNTEPALQTFLVSNSFVSRTHLCAKDMRRHVLLLLFSFLLCQVLPKFSSLSSHFTERKSLDEITFHFSALGLIRSLRRSRLGHVVLTSCSQSLIPSTLRLFIFKIRSKILELFGPVLEKKIHKISLIYFTSVHFRCFVLIIHSRRRVCARALSTVFVLCGCDYRFNSSHSLLFPPTPQGDGRGWRNPK